MDFGSEKRVARHLLSAIEDGSLSTSDLRPLYEDADPALVYLIFGWLRAHYHPGHQASAGVLGRIVALCSASPAVAKAARIGEKDAIAQWFEESHDYRSMQRDEFIDLIVEKLEG